MSPTPTTPTVSVLMAVYNGASYLRSAIESMLHQTFTDFEFIIINDASTDESEAIILSYTDERICYHKNESNLQLPASLNKGLALAKGKYIARMDADDISLSHRLHTQFNYMEAHPEIGICGSWGKIIGNNEGKIWRYPTEHEEIKTMLFFRNCLIHPTVFMRRSILKRFNLKYDEQLLRAQDWQLWIDATKHTLIANLPEVLLLYRQHNQNLTLKNKAISAYYYRMVRARNLATLDIHLSHTDLIVYSDTMHKSVGIEKINFDDLDAVFAQICRRNQEKKLFDNEEFEQYLVSTWLSYFRSLHYHSFEKLANQFWYRALPNWTKTFLHEQLPNAVRLKIMLCASNYIKHQAQFPQQSQWAKKQLTYHLLYSSRLNV